MKQDYGRYLQELSYKQLETTLIAHFRIKPDRVSTFKSRIKQLQRMEFPPGVNVGRGAKMGYSTEHLFKLVTAFELISIGLPAQTATGIVEKHWEELSGAYALASLAGWHTDSGRIFAELRLQSLSEIQFGAFGEPQPSGVTVRDHDSVSSALKMKQEGALCRPILKASDILERAVELALNVAGVRISRVELAKWRPSNKAHYVDFNGPYPDRSNLEVRRRLHLFNGNDPDSLTPDGEEEARDFHDQYILGNVRF